MDTANPRSQSWLNVTHTRTSSTVAEVSRVFTDLGLNKASIPVLTTLVGRRTKSEMLQQLTGGPTPFTTNGHGQVTFALDNTTKASSTPVVYVDYELLYPHNSQWAESGDIAPANVQQLEWVSSYPGAHARRRVANLMCDRVFGTISDTICYFASDLGGMRMVAAHLAAQATLPPKSDLAHESLPTVLIVAETTSRNYDCHVAASSLCKNVTDILAQQGASKTHEDWLLEHFRQIQVIAIPKRGTSKNRAELLRRRLSDLRQRACQTRSLAGLAFNAEHLYVLLRRLLCHFCTDYQTPFSFANESRPDGFCVTVLPIHLKELFSIIPSETWISQFICPLLASSIVLANYPPGAHAFPVDWLYRRIYRQHVDKVLSDAQVQHSTREAFTELLVQELDVKFKDLTNGSQLDAAGLHRESLVGLRDYVSMIRTHKTCLCCLLKSPEKVLRCGHAICDNCIQLFGKRLTDERYGFKLTSCPICGVGHPAHTFRFISPTAGVRVLSLDGGGIKGIIPLVFLQTLEEKVGVYGAPIYNYFDYVCGTSAGGLIVLGIFLMRWTIPECIQKFLRLAENTFRASSVTESTLGRLQHLALSYLRDCRYSSSAIERAFQSATGTDVEMFNPLSDDTKVAVTATTVKQPQPCIFSNYNGPPRSPGHGYDAIRHSFERRLSVSKAAASTSAAPWYFKPVNLKDVGTFQDGGLQHNNPLNMALWEVKFLWPDRPRPDLALSIGTGTNDSIPVRGPQSPARKRFLSRIFDTFMENMDGERLWREFRNSLPEKERDKYYRWNLPLDDPQPPLDDIRAMHHLRKRAEDHMACNIKIQPVLDALLASSFYLELDAIPKWKEVSYLCKGHIFCRIPMTKQGRQQLILDLAAKSYYFLILGRPVKCVGRVGKYAPPFSREISFTVPSLDDQIGITLRGVTSEPKTISGLPRTVREIMFAQRLEVPFGRSDHKRPEKRLPKLPRKRKMDDTDWF